MNELDSQIWPLLRRSGVWMGPHGVYSWALEADDAIVLVDVLAAAGNGIVGGDIWSVSPEKPPRMEYGWHCNRELSETLDAFAGRSATHAKERIRFLKARIAPGKRVLFEIVSDRPLPPPPDAVH